MSDTSKRWWKSMLAVVVAGGLSSGAAHAEVVFGNLGPEGTGSLATTDVDTSAVPFAQGFLVNNPPATHQLESVTLGLYNEVGGNPTATTVSIWSATSAELGALPDSLLHTSSPVSVGAKSLYTFSFSGVDLSPGLAYFVVPNNGATWYIAGSGFDATVATAQNDSGYLDRGVALFNNGTWQLTNYGELSLSVAVVPEPHTYVMLAGAGMAGLAMWRRRGRRAVKA